MAKRMGGSRKSRATKGRKTTDRGRRRTTKRSGSGKRARLKTRSARFFAKRTSRGRFKEMDEVGRSQKVDRRQKSRTAVRSGYGDRGDRAA